MTWGVLGAVLGSRSTRQQHNTVPSTSQLICPLLPQPAGAARQHISPKSSEEVSIAVCSILADADKNTSTRRAALQYERQS